MFKYGRNILFILITLLVQMSSYSQIISDKDQGELNQYMNNLREARHQNNQVSVTNFLNKIAFFYMDQNILDSSIVYFNQLLNLSIELENLNAVPKIYYNIGIVYFEMDQFDKSIDKFLLGLDYAKSNNNQYDLLTGYINLATSYQVVSKYDEAIDILLEGAKIAHELDNLKLLRNCYGMLAENYESVEQADNAFKYFDLFQSLDKRIKDEEIARLAQQTKDKVDEVEKEKTKTELKLNRTYSQLSETQDSLRKSTEGFQSELQEKEQALAEKDALIKSERQKQLIAFLGAAVVLAFSLLTVIQSRQKRKVILKLEEKNVEVELQRQKLEDQRDLANEQKKEITDSIEYAKRIQNALLPPDYFIKKLLPNHFLLFKPRDIVSGDFYWMVNRENKIILAVADCTGHGVPGAFMSMLGISHLNEIVNKFVDNQHIYSLQANEILNQLREYVVESLHQGGRKDDSNDGMDISLCILDQEKKKLQYSGAHNPLILIRDNKRKKFKADRMSVSYNYGEKRQFSNFEVDIENGDMLYLFTDGFADQLGGPKNRKYMSRYFYQLLEEIHMLPLPEQKEILEERLTEWMGDFRQIDDILVMGIKIEFKDKRTGIAGDYDWHEKTILIADDTEANYIFLVQALKNTGAKIIRARNGEEAVEIVKNNHEIDLVLMDVSMPKKDGFEATIEIREFSDIPIIAQTALNLKEAKRKSIESRCNDFILKPIKFKTFLSILEKFLN